jgi:hypothetical protein
MLKASLDNKKRYLWAKKVLGLGKKIVFKLHQVSGRKANPPFE